MSFGVMSPMALFTRTASWSACNQAKATRRKWRRFPACCIHELARCHSLDKLSEPEPTRDFF